MPSIRNILYTNFFLKFIIISEICFFTTCTNIEVEKLTNQTPEIHDEDNLPNNDDNPDLNPNVDLSRGGWDNRYFKFRGNFPYFVGMDLQQLASDTGIDYRTKIDLLAQYDMNKIRIWAICSFLGNYSKNLFPWRKVGDQYDLLNWNPDYFSRLKSFLTYAGSKNIIVEISIFELLGSDSYFSTPDKKYPFSKAHNIQNFGTPNSQGKFLPEFYDLNYEENGLKLQDLQKNFIDKIILETKDFDNIYYEILNEFPGDKIYVDDSNIHTWQQEMAGYLKSKTTKIVTIHGHGWGYGRSASDLEKSSSFYWSKDYIDGINFHLYKKSAKDVSDQLSGHQQKGKMLINNEGDEYYDINRSAGYPNYTISLNTVKLYGQIRHAWGHMTAGGYFLIYHGPVPQVGDEAWFSAAKMAQAMRKIVENVQFWKMKPIRANGTELDDLVTQGPVPSGNWQVISEEGVSYLIFFWGTKSNNSASINLPTGQTYTYEWYDTREWKDPLKTGTVGGGIASIPAPETSTWHQDSGIVLIIKK